MGAEQVAGETEGVHFGSLPHWNVVSNKLSSSLKGRSANWGSDQRKRKQVLKL